MIFRRTIWRGFPWHPHRGIETITYVLAGTVEHGDSMGNHGAIAAGDVQWMTAGSGIIHQEMPKGDAAGRMHGFQLWANLPSSLKMTAPRYQEVKAPTFPEITDDDGTHVRVVCGSFWGKNGPGRWHRGRSDLPGCVGASGPEEDASRSRPLVMPSLTFLQGAENSVMRRVRWPCRPKAIKWADTNPPAEADNRSLILFDRGDEVDGAGGRGRNSISAGVGKAA